MAVAFWEVPLRGVGMFIFVAVEHRLLLILIFVMKARLLVVLCLVCAVSLTILIVTTIGIVRLAV